MKHIQPATRVSFVPAQASLLVTQQKVAIFGAFAAALGVLGESIATWLDLDFGDE